MLLDADGVVPLTDFGVAKALQYEKVTQTGDVTGTLQYMAPERFRGQTNARSGTYSLGLTLYELLTLSSPWGQGDQQELMRRILNGHRSHPQAQAGHPPRPGSHHP